MIPKVGEFIPKCGEEDFGVQEGVSLEKKCSVICLARLLLSAKARPAPDQLSAFRWIPLVNESG